MSNHERLARLGRLTELRERFRSVEHRAEGVLESIRLATYVDPVAGALDLDADKIADLAGAYRELHAQGVTLRAAITQLEEELGLRPGQ
ncbi:MAG: hypothetical protein AAFY08_14065 [Planctomycetota bacterium]